MKVELSDTGRRVLTELLESHVQEVLDDQHGVPVMRWYPEMREAAMPLGLNIDEVIAKQGTMYEKKRLAEMLGIDPETFQRKG